MLARIRSRLTYANVMATIAVFIALGGGAYAAFKLPNNSVKSKHIVNGQVKEQDIAAAEPLHLVGEVGEPAFGSQNTARCLWSNLAPDHQPAAFFRDAFGVVHIQGIVRAEDVGAGCDFTLGHNLIFALPAGYTPAHRSAHAVVSNSHDGRVNIDPGGAVIIDPNQISTTDAKAFVTLDGISFRCAPSGENGCP